MMDRWAEGGVFGLVAGTIFKIAERQELSLAGSIPVRLRPRTGPFHPGQATRPSGRNTAPADGSWATSLPSCMR